MRLNNERFSARRRAQLEEAAEQDAFKQLEEEVKKSPKIKESQRPKG